MHEQDKIGSLVVVGLGPGQWNCLTVAAAKALQRAETIWFHSLPDSTVAELVEHLPGVAVRELINLGGQSADGEDAPHELALELRRRVAEGEPVTFVTMGSATVDERPTRLLLTALAEAGIGTQVLQGLGTESRGAVPAEQPDDWIEVLEASYVLRLQRSNAVGELAGFEGAAPWRAPTPTASLLVRHIEPGSDAEDVEAWLRRFYPPLHQVQVHRTWTSGYQTIAHRLGGVSQLIEPNDSLYVPPLDDMDNVRTFAGIMQLTRRLRAPDGCPWDRDQNHSSLKPHLLEETYEVLEALDSGDSAQMVEEFGDLLYQITIHSQVAAEAGEFTIEDVIEHLMRKLIGRHPHVFGDLNLESSGEVLQHWETFKQREKPKRASVLEQIPHGLPALPQSNLMQKRAGSVGFEWPSLKEVLAKVREELDELEHEVDHESSRDNQREEYGDILFALVSVARHLHLDPEEALRLANRKFAARFQYVESRVTALGQSLRDISPKQLDIYWEEAKALGSARHPEEAVSE